MNAVIPTPVAAAAPTLDLCQPALALRVLLVAQLWVAALVLLAAPAGQWWAMQTAVSLGVLLASGAWLAGLCAVSASLARWTLARQLPAVTLWGAACALSAWGAIAWTGLADVTATVVFGALATGALAAATGWRWLAQRARLAEPAQAQARLAELQSRIRPHFLFNALNAALALVRVDPERAERVLEDLGALFRQAMAESGSSVSLVEEIEFARRYLDIEQVRFGDRLRLSWAIDPKAGDARLPPLVLQPLVENAVKHGVEPSLDGGDIRITARPRQGLVLLEVSSSLPDEPSQPGAGMALANVAERLKLLHDMAAHIEAGPEDAPGGRRFVVRITVPA
jgi:two-component system, LytTR family, sensor histidine kinase AlgZ